MSLPPPGDECPICFLILPSLNTGRRYMSCCGKFICRGCIYAGAWAFVGYDQLCSFCRTPASKSGEESIEWIKKRVKVDDAVSIHVLGCDYAAGRDGLSQDRAKALELWHRAAELGHAGAYQTHHCRALEQHNVLSPSHYCLRQIISQNREQKNCDRSMLLNKVLFRDKP